MPFPLADLKRSYGRSGSSHGAPDVRPYLLVGKELEAQRECLATAIGWYEAREGRTRAEISADDFASLVGDYRLARCLASCIQSAFEFRPPAGAERAPAARLAVFDLVNELAAGYATTQQRPELLRTAAERLRVSPTELENMLWCDSPQRERLARVGPTPTVEALAAQYNRRALETLLVRALSADLLLRLPDGPTIRRIYFAVKRAGLLCELTLQEPDEGPAGGVWVHLFGPLEVFGPRTRHGDRFARAVLELLSVYPSMEGSARVLINEREYTLRLPGGLRAAPANADTADLPEDAVSFDSEVERHLYRSLRGMERTGDTRNWAVQREPEPIIHGTTVLVPDFALTRPATERDDPVRVFVEVVGFWTPGYRERKKAKLAALAGSVELVLVVHDDIAAHFADLPFRILPYKRRPSANDLILLLARAYPSRAPRRRVRSTDAPSAESARAEWEALFGLGGAADGATASASPATLDTPDAD